MIFQPTAIQSADVDVHFMVHVCIPTCDCLLCPWCLACMVLFICIRCLDTGGHLVAEACNRLFPHSKDSKRYFGCHHTYTTPYIHSVTCLCSEHMIGTPSSARPYMGCLPQPSVQQRRCFTSIWSLCLCSLQNKATPPGGPNEGHLCMFVCMYVCVCVGCHLE
jgi:hypothetical protein